MSTETIDTTGTAEELREVPANLSEYQKFVAEGGHEHNARIRGREAAEKAAQAAGLDLARGTDGERPSKPNSEWVAMRKISSLQRKLGARDERIAELERQFAAQSNGHNGHQATGKSDEEKPAPAAAKPAAKAADKTPPRPVSTDPKFKNYDDYIDALTDWKAARAVEEYVAKTEEERTKGEQEKAAQAAEAAYNARVDEAKTRYKDWKTVFDGMPNDSLSPLMYQYIPQSKKGPDVLYYLATHREELARIRELPTFEQIIALGRIEGSLGDDGEQGDGEDEEEGGEEKAAKPAKAKPAEDEDEDEKPAPKRSTASAHSKAPPPAKPLGGRGGADDSMPDPNNFPAYEKWRKSQQAKAKK